MLTPEAIERMEERIGQYAMRIENDDGDPITDPRVRRIYNGLIDAAEAAREQKGGGDHAP